MAVISKIRKQGGAAVLTIPPALLKLMELDVGAQVTLSVERGKLVAEPAAWKRKRYSLSELLKGSAGMKKLTAEAAWAQEGEPIGREIGQWFAAMFLAAATSIGLTRIQSLAGK